MSASPGTLDTQCSLEIFCELTCMFLGLGGNFQTAYIECNDDILLCISPYIIILVPETGSYHELPLDLIRLHE